MSLIGENFHISFRKPCILLHFAKWTTLRKITSRNWQLLYIFTIFKKPYLPDFCESTVCMTHRLGYQEALSGGGRCHSDDIPSKRSIRARWRSGSEGTWSGISPGSLPCPACSIRSTQENEKLKSTFICLILQLENDVSMAAWMPHYSTRKWCRRGCMNLQHFGIRIIPISGVILFFNLISSVFGPYNLKDCFRSCFM